MQQARGSFRTFVLDHHLDVVDAARFMAMVSVTYADAFIACFDAKYHYAFWRPVTAIRAGDTDATATVADPRGRRCSRRHRTIPTTRARTRVSRRPGAGRSPGSCGHPRSTTPFPASPGLGDRHFDTREELEDEVGDARIWGGIHFRTAVRDGIAIGKQVVRHVLANHFQRSWH